MENAASPSLPGISSSSPASGAVGAAPVWSTLTTKQKAVWDLKQAGKTYKEISAAIGIAKSTVSWTLQACYHKLGLKGPTAPLNRTEEKNPEKLAAVLDAMTEPAGIVKLKQAYAEAGLPQGVSEALVRRLKTKYFGAVTQTRNLKASEIAQLFSERIDLAARYMDDKTAGEASFRDLALAASAMAEKRQLMRGEPTQIISDHERKKLHELLPAFIEEAGRRGVTVQGQVTEKIVESV